MSYLVIITEPAELDIIGIDKYISQDLHSPQAADNLLDEFDKHILSLEEMPKRHALVDDERLARLGIRKIPVNNYLVFYRVDENETKVLIVRVLYGMRDWANIL